ncbi:MAG: bifunctional homocysteine S-methyltransferase/methylenetetrahydrofolate reductase [Lentisphaerae bacterium]|nr:bifunctional homocysteine S-methyltransferase/methylenetetrahydrofolate reductase [Lentisphaerota bacterium]
MSTYLQQLNQRPLILDGAMGTAIYEAGVFVNACYEELVLTNPALISGIHRAYGEAGADLLLTNTFGANRVKLRGFGLADRVAAINAAAVRLAREAAGPGRLVGGDVGPCQEIAAKLTEALAPEIEAAFAEQMQALAGAGADLIFLETFSDAREIQVAARAARATGLPVHASVTVDGRGETATGLSVTTIMELLEADPNIDTVGLNCAVGPTGLLKIVQTMLPRLTKPLLVKPNAGFPQQVGGRMLYLAGPEYFTEKAKAFIHLGVRGVGGCCGTTAEHIRVLAQTLKCLGEFQSPTPGLQAVNTREETPMTEAVAQADKSRLGARLARGERVSSVEILSPKGPDMTAMIDKARQCEAAGVDAINIPDGPRATARVAPLVAAMLIRQAGLSIEPVPHYCCRDRNLLGMQSDILGAAAAGIRNLLVITGDPPKAVGMATEVRGVFEVDAVGLTRLIHSLNCGFDLSRHPITPPAAMLIGVGANPCALDLRHEVDRLFRKIEAGAEYVITQPVFDPDALLRFLDLAANAPRRVPILAGLFPLISLKNAEFMRNEVPGVVVPDAVITRMAACPDRESARAAGIEMTRSVLERVADRVDGAQVSAPMGQVDTALRVLDGYIRP